MLRFWNSGDVNCTIVVLFFFFSLIVRRICRALLSIEDANMTASPPHPTWSRDPARYLMEKYWLWCVVETVHNPGKSFREDFRRAFEPLPSNTALPLFFVFLCNEPGIWCRAMGVWHVWLQSVTNPADLELHNSYTSMCFFTSTSSITLSCTFLCLCNVRALGSAWHFRRLAYIRASVINHRRFKAYYLCVHSWMAFTCAHTHTHTHIQSPPLGEKKTLFLIGEPTF